VGHGLGSLFNRRVGPLGALIIIAVGITVTVGIAQLLPEQDKPETTATATATPTACKALDPPYGDPPQDFTYAAVDEARRAETVKALKLDETDGKVDVLTAKQTSSNLSLGEIVGVPSQDPAQYASSLIASFQTAGAKVEDGNGYAILPLASGKQVAVGVKGCRTVLITALDPEAAKFLAAAIFT